MVEDFLVGRVGRFQEIFFRNWDPREREFKSSKETPKISSNFGIIHDYGKYQGKFGRIAMLPDL